MDDEKHQRATDAISKMDALLAQSQARDVLADTVLALLAHGRPVNVQTLIAELLAAVQHFSLRNMTRMKHEAAARLLGWTPASSSAHEFMRSGS